jgi:hypothetical protein
MSDIRLVHAIGSRRRASRHAAHCACRVRDTLRRRSERAAAATRCVRAHRTNHYDRITIRRCASVLLGVQSSDRDKHTRSSSERNQNDENMLSASICCTARRERVSSADHRGVGPR